MSLLNAALVKAADLLLAPVGALPPLLGLTIVSLVTAAAMLAVFKRTSDQSRLRAVKRAIHAALFEIRLYNDDFRAILHAQLEMLRHNATYLRLSLMPMLWVIVPLVLVMAQLQFFYGYAPLQPGAGALLKVQLRTGSGEAVSLEAPPELRLGSHGVWFPGAREVVWKVAPTAPGSYDVRVKVGSDVYTKTLQIAGGVVRRSPVRLESGFINQLLYPSEPPLPGDGPVTAITVAYPESEPALFGWELNWMVWFFVLSIVFAFALKKPFGVTV
jgi:uncharacterized membrane protein (DUF106 family)